MLRYLSFAGVKERWQGLLLFFWTGLSRDHAGDLLQLVPKVLAVFLKV
jgi:hypothetical protein